MRAPLRRSLRLIGAAAVALSLSPARAEERTVNFYNWSNYMAPGVLEDFTRETGIKVVYDTFDANETLETRLLAGKSGYDVVVADRLFPAAPDHGKGFPQARQVQAAEPRQRLAGRDRPACDLRSRQQLRRQLQVWGTTGIGYNVKTAQKILGPDAKIDSWDMVFKPENLAKFRDCGIHMLDSADDILPAALGYLRARSEFDQTGRSGKGRRARQQDQAQRAQVSFLGISGGAGIRRNLLRGGMVGRHHAGAQPRGGSKNGIEIGYAIPKEGAQMFFDNLAIPADAKNVTEAYELINYLYRPDVAAKNSDFLSYANGNLASQKLVDPKILNDRNIYPDEATQKKLFVINARDPATQRVINRLWTRVKTGK